MTIVAVTGDTATTTSVALAAAWPEHDDVLLVEADPTGGDLAAWLDIPVSPSLSTIVTRVLDGSWGGIEQLTRTTTAGLRVVPAPPREAEATQAVRQSARTLVPTLAVLATPITIGDIGRVAEPGHPFLDAADVVVAVHRQSTQSARAAAVRVDRFAQRVASLTTVGPIVVAAVVGGRPFTADEVAALLDERVGPTPTVGLPVDDLSAAVLAGRTGVSARRLARLPLSRAATELAAACVEALGDVTPTLGDPIGSTP